MLSNPEFVADLEDCIPLKRVAETHEITGVIAFLCMPASSFTTGQTICIDGGLTAHGFTPKSFLGAWNFWVLIECFLKKANNNN